MLGTDFVERDEYGGVNGARDVEKGAGHALHARDAAFLKLRCGRGVRRVLHLGPICRCEPFVGRVLRALWKRSRYLMTELGMEMST